MGVSKLEVEGSVFVDCIIQWAVVNRKIVYEIVGRWKFSGWK